ncbi:MAG: S8/S53 family peptidase [Ktedonobacteraceae bacterium]|nr:S8/S53 family peptidase [Ktedonobacteraceae bacterium]
MSDFSLQHKVVLSGSRRQPPPAEAKVVGPLTGDEMIEVKIALHPQQRIDEQEIYDRSIAGLPPLSQEEVAARFSANPIEMEQVKNFARSQGLTIDDEKTSVQNRVVVVRGTAQAVSDAFGAQAQRYVYKGISFRGRSGPLYVPHELDGVIAGVFGIDDRPQTHTSAQRSTVTSHTVTQVASLYEFPTAQNGSGQCIALIELGGGYRASDLQTYFNSLKLAMPCVVGVSVDGVENKPGIDSGADEEVTLDIEVAGAVAPGATIAVYFAPNTEAGFLDAVQAAMNDKVHTPSVISISWGQYEAGWTLQALTILNLAFQQAALLGITICCASGDSGAQDSGSTALTVDFPASSPYVLACGGTHLSASSSAIIQERVWNDSLQSATGGGVSAFFTKLAWQRAVTIPFSHDLAGRGVPDVAANADPQTGYQILVNGQVLVVGGTSAVAPLWAGLLVLFNQSLGRRVGYLNPVLYQRVDHSKTFHDITIGSNNGYTATSGWDLCTGWGTPRGLPLLNALRGLLA